MDFELEKKAVIIGPIGVIRINREGQVIACNPEAALLLDLPKGDLTSIVGRKVTEIPSLIDASRAAGLTIEKAEDVASLADHIPPEGIFCDLPLTTVFGNEAEVSIHTIPMFDMDGQFDGFMTLLRDVPFEAGESKFHCLRKKLADLSRTADWSVQLRDADCNLSKSLEKAVESLDAHCGAVFLFDEKSLELTLKIHHGLSDEAANLISRMTPDRNFALRISRGVIVVPVASLPGFIESFPGEIITAAQQADVRSVILAPLSMMGSMSGVIWAAICGDRVPISSDKAFMSILSCQLSLALENDHLQTQAQKARSPESVDQARNDYLANIFHGLRTPLTAIKGFADSLLQTDVEWDADTRLDFIRAIDQESDRLRDMISALLEMSRIEAGIMELNLGRSDISFVLDRLTDRLRSLARNHELKMVLPSDLPLVFIDEMRVEEAVTNLVENAVDYSPHGTKIAVEAKLDGDDILVSVTDEGYGIPEDSLELVFERFYRTGESSRYKSEGLGLGLAICKGIIETHSGAIWVNSKLGSGTTFTFSLPTVGKL